jgi:branched-chain amino acid transport system ATP-binding protein
MADPLLEVTGLEVVYNRAIRALHGVSLLVESGQIVAVLGANGAGKTTTLRAISGFIALDRARITKGRIRFRGEVIENLPPHLVTRRGIVLVPERDKVFPNLTVLENITAVSSSRGGAAQRRRLEAAVFEYFPHLAELRGREAGLLSGGERQMLAIGAALACNPTLLLVDELSLGLAPIIVTDLVRRLVDIRRALGIAILLVEQNATAALSIADQLYILENGGVALEGNAETLRTNEAVRRAYLGAGARDRVNYREVAARRAEVERHG